MRLAIILGTRPEIIKMSPIIRECERLKLDYFILHTGQHYSYNMDRIFFEQLGLPQPKHNLDVGSGTHAEETGRMLIGIEKVLVREKPEVVLVEGDTNTVLAGALVASKLHIKVGHVEAGLRSYDKTMPEEINRILTDHLSDYLFAPTVESRDILIKEGIWEEKIQVTGNTIVDAMLQNLKTSYQKYNVLKKMDLQRKNYFLVTAHRQENVDDKRRLEGIIEGLKLIHDRFNLPIIYPMHPRTEKRMEEFNLKAENITIIKPVGYLKFIQLESNARLILTDSGGIQEESCISNIPCVTLRDNTERPETLEVGSNILAGTNADDILNAAQEMMERKTKWKNPFGDGKSGERIVEILVNA